MFPPCARINKSCRGVSLLEAIICTFMLAILTLISVPNLRAAKDRAALQQALAATEQLLAEAAFRATSTGATVRATLSGESRKLSWRLHNDNGVVFQSISLAEGVTLLEARFAEELSSSDSPAPRDEPPSDSIRTTISYYPTGAVSPGSLVLHAGSRHCRLVQPLRGSVRVEWNK